MDIVEELLKGNRLALSRAITAIENEYDEAMDIMKKLYPHTGHAFVLGITGPPGAGKSTLTDKLARAYRAQGKTVGIIAIDPTSPFTGGAILGDRIRMNGLTMDEGVFIRSMGTRGSLGGLSHKTADAVKAMDAFGKDIIFVETVGVGQSEVDIVKAADTTMVVLIPGMGDDIQAIKAGILEIGDVFTINKAELTITAGGNFTAGKRPGSGSLTGDSSTPYSSSSSSGQDASSLLQGSKPSGMSNWSS